MPSMRVSDTQREAQRGVLSYYRDLSQVQQTLRVPVSREGFEQDGSSSASSKRLDIGFTGTRRGMSQIQRQQVMDLLSDISVAYPDYDLWAHHGDCVESDEDFHDMARSIGYRIHVHPPDNRKLRAFCIGDKYEPTKPYKIRNADIVRESQLLIATPHFNERDGGSIYSGTWATVRIAKRRSVPYVIFHSDGRREGKKWQRFLTNSEKSQ